MAKHLSKEQLVQFKADVKEKFNFSLDDRISIIEQQNKDSIVGGTHFVDGFNGWPKAVLAYYQKTIDELG